MARIAGVTLPANKRIVIALTYIYGIGNSLSKDILAAASIDPAIRVKDLDDKQVNDLRGIIDQSYKVEGDLRQNVLLNIKRLKEVGTYRGMRHSRYLPARGQRTKTNSRTVRGNVRRTAGSGRKPAAQKT